MFTSSPEDKSWYIEVDQVIRDIARYMFSMVITDDNPSPSSGLTGLEQLIFCWIGLTLDDDINWIKDSVILKFNSLQGGCHLYKDSGIEEEDLQVREEWELENIYRIAQYVFIGFVTDDNPSNQNNLTGLDQVIMFGFDFRLTDDISKIKKRVLSRVHELQGGCNMTYFEEVNS